ncbi:hypothetical protein [Sulfitobacter sp. 20_GPM-1509m]|uniref:hypothetical protein n=1 Tax=Sulfitobacter sp. 20_GPM-1509m TaxID=1380367 RepID=UPI0012DE94D6|nr:hypothetical protein [Sulfitobacter sp. 20_GPM-1509m]
MALIRSQWRKLEPVSVSQTDRAIREWLKDLDETEIERGVYVIRFARPYSVNYPNRPSPVLYIGEGDTLKRLQGHLKNWLRDLSKTMPGVWIDARVTQPRVQRNAEAYKEVEADLLSYFCEVYGAMPLFNKNKEYFGTSNQYTRTFLNVLNPGSGKGYKWAISPLRSNERQLKMFKPWRAVEVVAK